MTPDEAREVLDYGEEWKRRRHRYKLEGGRRCVWECQRCGWKTEAETGPEAQEKLLSCSVPCDHPSILQHADQPMPPADFS